MVNLNIEKISSLDEYILNLGILGLSLNRLMALQAKAESIGIFDNDETEMSKTVQYQTDRLLGCVNDLLVHVGARTNIDWKDTVSRMIEGKKPAKKKPKREK